MCFKKIYFWQGFCHNAAQNENTVVKYFTTNVYALLTGTMAVQVVVVHTNKCLAACIEGQSVGANPCNCLLSYASEC